MIKSALPHHNVYTCLKPSKIDGIGVFAIRNIRRGTDIFPDIDDEIVWVAGKKVKALKGNLRRLYEYYCVRKDGKYGAPTSFNQINVSWYLNHSSKPNAVVDRDYHVIAGRNIKSGEEITLDYTTFMDMSIPNTWI